MDQMGEWGQKVQKSSYKINDELVNNTLSDILKLLRQSIFKSSHHKRKMSNCMVTC